MSKNIDPYTPVVSAGDIPFVSGQIGILDRSIAEGPVARRLDETVSTN